LPFLFRKGFVLVKIETDYKQENINFYLIIITRIVYPEGKLLKYKYTNLDNSYDVSVSL